MIENITQIHLFYPLLFFLIIVIVVTIGVVLIKDKDNNLFCNVFNKSNDNAKEITIDTTDKFNKSHTEVIALPRQYEEELHSLEKTVKHISETVNILAQKVELLNNNQK